MGEVDSNLNYLLGRLSLVTQEFNQIKHGLGSALDNIRSSFQIVQNKMQGNPLRTNGIMNYVDLTLLLLFLHCSLPDVGPGPHKIESEENIDEPDIKLLPQRDQPSA